MNEWRRILALLAACFGVFYFGIIGTIQILNFHYQGQPDPFASELPGVNLPAVSFHSFLISIVPLAIGTVASIAQMALAFILIFTARPVSSRLRTVSAIVGFTWIVVLAQLIFQLGKNLILPTFGQNLMMTLFFSGPIMFSLGYSLWIAVVLRKASALKENLSGRKHSDSVDLIREDRDR